MWQETPFVELHRACLNDTRMATKRPAPPTELFPLIYGGVGHVQPRYLGRERQNHTLQPTALVHEAWMKLQNERGGEWQGRTHGLALAAQAMRRLLVDHGRHQKRQKRGGGAANVALDDLLHAATTSGVPVEDLLTLEAARPSWRRSMRAPHRSSSSGFSQGFRCRRLPNICRSRRGRWRRTGRTRARGSSASCQARTRSASG
jgi:RNA polymerase sigma factor (TIGR02999 family)